MKPLYIFDIDGTVSLVGARKDLLKTQDSDRWDKFYSRSYEDKPNENVIKVLNALIKSGAEIIFFTGRRNSSREDTADWFHDFVGISLDKSNLFMRKDGDWSPDDKLKSRWLDALSPNDANRLVGVFEDRQRVVDMYREKGITVFQVATGDF